MILRIKKKKKKKTQQTQPLGGSLILWNFSKLCTNEYMQ